MKFLYSALVCSSLASLPLMAQQEPAASGAPAVSGALARQLNDAFASVYEKVAPAVVVIEVRRASDSVSRGLPEGWEYFWKAPDGRRLPAPTDEGSGFIISKDGYIITNNHVVSDAAEDGITVQLKDGRKLAAQLIGQDEKSDIAVIKVEGTDLPVAELADSNEAKVGQFAFAIGAPFDLPYTFTVGVISAKGRTNLTDTGRTGHYEEYIQTDASINPGNSGGPLCDIDGRVVGVNTLISGMNRGLGFAVPINIAKDIGAQLITNGRVSRPWLGIDIVGIEESEEAQRIFPDVKKGVVVNRIHAQTPADASALQAGDVILKVDGVEVSKGGDLQREILSKKVGQDVQIELWRNGAVATIALQTGEQPDRMMPANNRRTAPPSLKDERPSTKKRNIVPNAHGLVLQDPTSGAAISGVTVTEIVEGSAAAASDLQVGDVITEVAGKVVTNRAEFASAMSQADLARGVMIQLDRKGQKTFAILKP